MLLTAFCSPPLCTPRPFPNPKYAPLPETLKNADYAGRQGSDKVAATPPMASKWRFTQALDGLLAEAFHNKIVPGPCNKKGCNAPDGGFVAGGQSCDEPENHGQMVSEASVWARLRVFHEQAKLSVPIDSAFYKKCLTRWKFLCKGCCDGHHAHSATTM